MDYIKKTICIEAARTRTQGLMPYYEFGKEYEIQHISGDSGYSTCFKFNKLGLESASGENGNWGQIVANPCFLATNGKTYESMLDKYYRILNMVRNGVKLRKVATKEGEIFTEDVGAFEWNGNCFEGGEEPDSLYVYFAYNANDFLSTEIDSLRPETRRIYRTVSGVESDFIVLINEYDKFIGLSSYLDGVNIPSTVTTHSIGNDEHTKWANYCMIVDDLIGKINIPASIYNKHIKVPKSMPCADVQPYIDWLEENKSLSADCCNARLYEDMGGQDMLDELINKHESECEKKRKALEGLEYSVPYLEMPILLTQNSTDIGVLTNIDGVKYSGETPGPVVTGDTPSRPHGKMTPDANIEESGLTQFDIDFIVHSGVGVTIDQIIMGNTLSAYPTTEMFDAVMSAVSVGITDKLPVDYIIPSGQTRYPIEVESLLGTLRNRKKYTDDRDNVLPGIFKKYSNPAGEMYVCIKMSDNPNYYELVTSSYTITEGGVEKTVYCVVYDKRQLTENDIVGMNNRRTSYTRMFSGGLETLEDAKSVVREQMEGYGDGDESFNPKVWRISVIAPVWTMSALTAYEPNDCISADGYMSGDKIRGNEGPKYSPSDNYNNPTNKFYRTITTCAAGIRIAETEEEETGVIDSAKTHYYFFVKYDNSSGSPMTVPYLSGNTANVYLVSRSDDTYIYRGDFILSAVPNGSFFEVEYVIGGYFEGDEYGRYIGRYGDKGDVYYEKHPFDTKHVDYVALDGVDNVPVWSEYIDFKADMKEFYSPRYNLYRTGNTANIIRMSTGDIWNKDFAYDAYLTKEEYLTNFSQPPKVDVDVTIDRGGVSAFERHYNLAECNTMQDLERYKNNVFFDND